MNDLLSTKETAEMLGTTEGYLRGMRNIQGRGPHFIRVEMTKKRHLVKYNRVDVITWMRDEGMKPFGRYAPERKRRESKRLNAN